MKIFPYILAAFIFFSCKKNSDVTNQNSNNNNNNINGIVSDTIGHSLQLWGMTSQGGLHDGGVIFQMKGDGSDYNEVFPFSDTSGTQPYGALCKAPNGKLYGMTSSGGAADDGTIFSFDPSTSTFKKLLDLGTTAIGGHNFSGLMLANDNNLYGASDLTLFKLNPLTDEITILADFAALIDGSGTWGGKLIQGADGKLYGCSHSGGLLLGGAIFSFDIVSHQLTVMHNFNPLNSQGYLPWGSLCFATDNNFYGICGMDTSYLFKLDPIGNYSILKRFDEPDGKSPWWNCGVVQTNGNKLYGMTMSGGPIVSRGVLFSYDFGTNVYAVEHSFGTALTASVYDGMSPMGTVMLASNNHLYGTTQSGGTGFLGATAVFGTVFRYFPANGEYKLIHAFKIAGGHGPTGNLIEY